ncbi:hypothetical protein ACWEQL_34070 [Kitasatospora sp. NPDC004240]
MNVGASDGAAAAGRDIAGSATGAHSQANNQHITIIPPMPAAPPAMTSDRSKGRNVALYVLAASILAAAIIIGPQLRGDDRNEENRGAGAQGTSTAAPAPTVTAPVAPATERPPSAPAGKTPTGGAAGQDGIRYKGEVKLRYLDLDAKPPALMAIPDFLAGFNVDYSVGSGQSAAVISMGGGIPGTVSVARYKESSDPSRQRCSDLLKTQSAQTVGVDSGARLCVRTALGRIAFVAVGRFSEGAFSGTVTVWEEED